MNNEELKMKKSKRERDFQKIEKLKENYRKRSPEELVELCKSCNFLNKSGQIALKSVAEERKVLPRNVKGEN